MSRPGPGSSRAGERGEPAGSTGAESGRPGPAGGASWPGPRVPYVPHPVGGPCFVCRLVRGDPARPEVVVHRDRLAVTFLARPGVVPGHALVAPVRHAEDVIGDLPVEEYLAVQRRVHSVGTAVSAVVPTERLYVLSLGSRQGNAHVHWHVVPLPPGVPYADQQLGLFDLARLGVPDIDPAEQRSLAAELRERLGDAP